MSLSITFTNFWSISRDGDSTTAPGSLFHCQTTLSLEKVFQCKPPLPQLKAFTHAITLEKRIGQPPHYYLWLWKVITTHLKLIFSWVIWHNSEFRSSQRLQSKKKDQGGKYVLETYKINPGIKCENLSTLIWFTLGVTG